MLSFPAGRCVFRRITFGWDEVCRGTKIYVILYLKTFLGRPPSRSNTCPLCKFLVSKFNTVLKNTSSSLPVSRKNRTLLVSKRLGLRTSGLRETRFKLKELGSKLLDRWRTLLISTTNGWGLERQVSERRESSWIQVPHRTVLAFSHPLFGSTWQRTTARCYR